MAAGLKPFFLALVAALCLHWVGIAGIGSQMQSATSVLEQRSDPLFTRTISAATAPEPAAPPVAQTPQPRPQRAAVIQSTPAPVTPTLPPELARIEPSRNAPETSTPVVQTTPVPSLTASLEPATASAASLTPTAAAQTMTSAPSGNTDSLLITGQWPGDTRVSYNLTGFFQGELFGKGEVQWTRSGQNNERYQVRVTVDAGLVELRLTSQGRVSALGLLPEAFEEHIKRVLQQPRLRPLKLEENVLILGDGRRVPRPVAQPMAVQDTVSQFIDLGHRIAQGRDKLEEGQVIRIWLGRPGGLDEWIYDVGPAETMQLPRIGPVTVHALKPRPLAQPRGTITMSMWLAPSLQYLPAKIRIQLNPEAYAELIAEQLLQR
jgi:Protein of unknown function (DUF3108)